MNSIFLKKRFKSVLAMATVLVFLMLMIPCVGCVDSSDDPGPFECVKTMTFNMKCQDQINADEQIYTWENRLPGIVKSFSDYEVNIVGSQELQTWQTNELSEALGENYSTIGEPRSVSSTENCNIFYRNDVFECLEWDTIWLSETPDVAGSIGWEGKYPRIMTWGKFKVIETEQEFYYLNTHLDHVSSEARINGLKLVLSYMDSFSDYPVIMTGDLNMYESSSEYDCMREREDDYPNTFAAFEEKFAVDNKTSHGFNGGTEGKAIDFIFYSAKDFDLESTDIIYDKYGIYYLSDHYPVYSVLYFK